MVLAEASCELCEDLCNVGDTGAASRWFRCAHRLQPDNCTYGWLAWFYAHPLRIGPKAEE